MSTARKQQQGRWMGRLAGFWVAAGGLLILLTTWSVAIFVIRADRMLEIERARHSAAKAGATPGGVKPPAKAGSLVYASEKKPCNPIGG